MKANEAPKKLYIDSKEHWMKSWTAFTIKAKGDDIEYTRTDAFIEKAFEFFAPHIQDNSGGYDRAYIYEKFKKYMEE